MFMLADLRYAFRLLRRTPFFTLITILVLSGGLALSVFTFSFLHTAMVKPLPLSEGGRVVRIQQAEAGGTHGIDAADLARMRPNIRTLAALGAFASQSFVVGAGEHRRVIEATVTEWNIFQVTRTGPFLGRGFLRDDQRAGAEPTIVLGYATWRALFGTDPAIINQHILLNGKSTRVIGVMPAGYGFPVASDAWVSVTDEVLATSVAGTASFNLYARLAAGVSHAQAGTELNELLRRARQDRLVRTNEPIGLARIAVRSFPMAQFDDKGPLFFTVMNVLAGLILLIACINVTNLLLARANERARETAVRMALGATRARLIVQNMWESVLLCLLGGALATAIAARGLTAINGWAQSNLQGNLAFWWVWRLDRAALIAAGGFVTATIALLGGVVAARATNKQFSTVLRDAGARSGGRREGRFSRALIVAQVAAVTVLMFFGVLTAIVGYRVANVEVGYDTHNLLGAAIALPNELQETEQQRAAFYQSVMQQMGNAPAVAGALVRSSSADKDDAAGAIELADRTAALGTQARSYVLAVLGPLSTLGIAQQSGRAFDDRDDERGLPVALVSRAFAERHWPGRSPLGQRIRLTGLGPESEWRTVVGVVGNVLFGNPLSRSRSADAVYVPLRQSAATSTTILFKHRGDAVAAQAALYQALTQADARVALPQVSLYEEILDKSSLLARSVARLFGFCIAFALLLALTGTYGLMARSIGRRRQELGIRRALGATDVTLVQLLLAQGGRQLGIGVLIAAPLMAAVGFGFWHFVPIGWTVSLGSALLVAACIVGAVLLATYLPTRRALRVSAREAIWSE
jgi:predicted permease